MIQRCENPKNKDFKDYGGRGICIAPELRTFEGFYAVLGDCPHALTLDRIDVNGNYAVGNVRWVPQADQKRNMRKNRYLTYDGKTLTVSEWARERGMYQATLDKRIKRGWPVERALSYV